ncbi:FAD-dependent oxidoreductase [Nonomuraea sp. KM88]|uniref:FAD-dependent oxidoreductase n=1 Tax=Nonomuraea sp. KM88 TaxID=3457427 RepID=UPI003FCD443A
MPRSCGYDHAELLNELRGYYTVGAEAAAVAAGLGVHVTMVEPGPAPMAGVLGAELGGMLAEVHAERGVHVRCGTAIAALTGSAAGEVTGAALTDGTHVAADAVLVGVGTVPATAWLSGSTIPLSSGVVECDAYGQAIPAVYAAGDVCAWHHPRYAGRIRVEHRTSAAEQGALAAANLLAAPDARRPLTGIPYFWSDQYDPKIQAFGLVSAGCEVEVVHGGTAERRLVAAYSREGRPVGLVGIGMPRQLRACRTLLASGAA